MTVKNLFGGEQQQLHIMRKEDSTEQIKSHQAQGGMVVVQNEPRVQS